MKFSSNDSLAMTNLPISVPSTTDGRISNNPTLKHVTVKLVKAFVQPDGSYGNGAGVVLLLPGNLHDQRGRSDGANRVDENLCDRLSFPLHDECLRIAKRVGLPETSFVLFLKGIDEVLENRDGVDAPYRRVSNGEKIDVRKACADTDVDPDRKKATAEADFHVKWYTPECEVDMCGHATVALAGYIHMMGMAADRKPNVHVDTDTYRHQRKRWFWRMQCKAGLLGIEVVEDGGRKSVPPGVPSEDGTQTENENFTSLPRVIMEQAAPKFCGSIDCEVIATSLSIDAETDLAITVADGKSEARSKTTSEKPFPFLCCEIVSTGGRDLMIPVRSTALRELDVLGNRKSGNQIQKLCDSINDVSKRYDIVGYHMFEIDDDLFANRHYLDDNNETCVEKKLNKQDMEKGQTKDESNANSDCRIPLNELIRVFQTATERGWSGPNSCLKTVLSERPCELDRSDDACDSDGRFGDLAASIARQSRVIVVTGVRNFAPFVGIPEEPATGSANGALACYLVKHLFLEACSSCDATPAYSAINFRFSMEQGRVMGEPCLIDAEIEVINGSIETVKVGGLVNVTGDGLDLDLSTL